MEIKVQFEIGVSAALLALLTAMTAGSTPNATPVVDLKADKKAGKKEEKSVAEQSAAKEAEQSAAKEAEQSSGLSVDKLRVKARELGDGKKADIMALLKTTFAVRGIGDIPPERWQEFSDALDNLQDL